VSTGSQLQHVDVRHGTVGVTTWGDPPGAAGTLRVAVCVHGVDRSAASFAPLAAELADSGTTLVTPDLRGRASSFGQPPPWGIAAHAEDVAALVEQLGTPVTLVGHSMGGHVAAVVAATRGDLVDRLVLVDGGLPRVVPPGQDAATVAAVALANIVPNLDATTEPDAVRADLLDMVADPAVSLGPSLRPGCPVHLVRAGLGVVPEAPPVVPDAVVDAARGAGVDLTDEVVPGATHFTVLSAPAGVRRVAAALR
jgi:pimeloyl-ACP methyl ester carboxylesterase